MGDVIDFEERSGWIKNVAATRRLAEQTLEQQAVSIINVALADHLDPTSSEYVAPADDPA